MFTRKQRVLLATLPPVVAWCLKGLLATCRKEVRGIEHWEQVLAARGRVVVAVWHDAMMLAVNHYRNTGFHTLGSYSYDGEFGARVVDRFGIPALRGSSSKGGSDALADMAEALNHVAVVGLTLDGPRGPRRVAKPGVAILAARTGIPIIPHAFAVHPAWHLHSWDRSSVPKPFAHIDSVYGPAIPPPDDLSPEAIEVVRLRIETGLNRLHADIER